LFRLLPRVSNLQKLWSDFFAIINQINKDGSNAMDINTMTKAWVADFAAFYQAKYIIPYMHAFSMHVGEFNQLYGNIAAFNQRSSMM